MSNGMKVLGPLAVPLLLGALFTVAYGSSWMGIGRSASGHHGSFSHMGEADCWDGVEECDMEDGGSLISCCEDGLQEDHRDGELGACGVSDKTSGRGGACNTDVVVEDSGTGAACH